MLSVTKSYRFVAIVLFLKNDPHIEVQMILRLEVVKFRSRDVLCSWFQVEDLFECEKPFVSNQLLLKLADCSELLVI